jgi:dihydroorotase
MTTPVRLTLPRWHDLHAHFRQGGMTAHLIKDHLKMGCTGILAMPNTKPPIAKIFKKDKVKIAGSESWSIQEYMDFLMKSGADKFENVIVPMYLTRETTPKMIEAGAKAGILKAAKYYPPHGTTGAEFGAPMAHYMKNGVLRALSDNGVILCVHGEEHGLSAERYFARGENAEEIFYKSSMPKIVKKFPYLKIVCEHVTTAVAVKFVQSAGKNVAASITPQHLIYTVGDLLRGFKYHLYCLPLIKFDDDRAALRKSVTAPGQTQFFAGTDSAPHAKKVTECGCAAGAYTGGIAPQLYAKAFEMAGVNLGTTKGASIFRRFLCDNGPAFYGIKPSKKTFTLEKNPQKIGVSKAGADTIIPLPVGMDGDGKNAILEWRIK